MVWLNWPILHGLTHTLEKTHYYLDQVGGFCSHIKPVILHLSLNRSRLITQYTQITKRNIRKRVWLHPRVTEEKRITWISKVWWQISDISHYRYFVHESATESETISMSLSLSFCRENQWKCEKQEKKHRGVGGWKTSTTKKLKKGRCIWSRFCL